VLTLALAAQWRRGTPWHGERSCLRYARKHLRCLFPGLTSQSAFNRRMRRLWGAFILLQQAVAEQLVTAQECEIIDGVPVRLAHGARSFHPRRLAEIARIGKGGTDRYFYGLHLLLAISSAGSVTGWTLASANVQERWLAELLLSARAGCPQLTGPLQPGTTTPRLFGVPAWSRSTAFWRSFCRCGRPLRTRWLSMGLTEKRQHLRSGSVVEPAAHWRLGEQPLRPGGVRAGRRQSPELP
jgi:hypothetical protein